jgi:hypothetical protein
VLRGSLAGRPWFGFRLWLRVRSGRSTHSASGLD